MLNVLIRCDASINIGLGHITRCLVLANQFRAEGHHVNFALKNHQLGIEKVTEQGFDFFLAPNPFNYQQWITSLVDKLKIDIFVGDVRDGLPVETIEQLKKQTILTVAIDEPSNYRRACDLCFYPPHAQLEKLDWSGFTGEIKQGLEYVLLRPEFYLQYPSKGNKIPKVAVIMGGTDPNRYTLKIVNKLLMLPQMFSIEVVCPPSHPDRHKLLKYPITLYKKITNMAQYISSVDHVVITFGTLAYEVAFMNVPATHIYVNEDQKQATQYFKANGFAESIDINDFSNSHYIPTFHIKLNDGQNINCLNSVISVILQKAKNEL